MVQSRAERGGHEHEAGRRIWLIRHGETTAGSSTRFYGATDVPLAELGREQVASLEPFVAPQRFAVIACSPLSRARTSAEVVRGLLHEPPAQPDFVVAEELREVDFGEIEGWTAQEIERDRPDWFARWQEGRIDGFPGGETLDGFFARVASGIDRLLAEFPDGDLCIVAHRGVVKNAVCHLCELPRSLVRRWPLDLGSACVLAAPSGAAGGPEGGRRHLLDRYNLCAP